MGRVDSGFAREGVQVGLAAFRVWAVHMCVVLVYVYVLRCP